MCEVQGMKKFIGSKQFYKTIITISIPIILYQALTNVLGLVDNIMVGSLGKEAMSGVAITTQILFVFNFSLFGLLAGPGVFISQFTGAKDDEGIKNCFRYKIIAGLILLLIAFLIIGFGQDLLIKSFLHENTEADQMAFNYAKQYLKIMFIGLPPFLLATIYSTTIRETGHTVLPLVASSVSIGMNLILNYILIFGIKPIGFEGLGVEGAAIATVISRFVELLVIVIASHSMKDKMTFMKNIYRPSINRKLAREIFMRGLPLFINEILWSFGVSFLVNIYSNRGLDTLASFNISSNISNLFYIFSSASGMALSIYIGNLLGASRQEEARENVSKFIFFNILCCLLVGGIFIIASFFIPNLYDVSKDIKMLSTRLMIVAAFALPVISFNTSCYFTLRAGGVTIITFLFDSLFTWVFSIPVAFLLVNFKSLYIVLIYAIVQGLELIKSVIGGTLINKGVWIRNITNLEE